MQSSQTCNQDPTPTQKFEVLLTEHEVARIIGMSVAAIRRWRLLNSGPPYIKLNHSVRYDPGALRSWLASRPCGGHSAAEARNG